MSYVILMTSSFHNWAMRIVQKIRARVKWNGAESLALCLALWSDQLGRECSSVVELLHTVWESLGSISKTTNKMVAIMVENWNLIILICYKWEMSHLTSCDWWVSKCSLEIGLGSTLNTKHMRACAYTHTNYIQIVCTKYIWNFGPIPKMSHCLCTWRFQNPKSETFLVPNILDKGCSSFIIFI